MKLLLTLLLFAAALPLAASPKLVAEAVKAAAKVSGKTLTQASGRAARKIVAEAFAKYGDDALRVTRHGGLEAIRCGAKYGDDFWRLTRGATPAAARSIALHADDLMPLAKRLGPDIVRLEGKAPGLGAKIVAEFGDDTARYLAKNAPAEDIGRLLGYAGKADSPATKELLLRGYRSGGGGFLAKLNWKQIMATGLSAAAITAAYKVSDGVEDGLKIAAEKNPRGFLDTIGGFMTPFRLLFSALAVLLLIPPLYRFSRWWYKKWKTRKEPADAETPEKRP